MRTPGRGSNGGRGSKDSFEGFQPYWDRDRVMYVSLPLPLLWMDCREYHAPAPYSCNSA